MGTILYTVSELLQIIANAVTEKDVLDNMQYVLEHAPRYIQTSGTNSYNAIVYQLQTKLKKIQQKQAA